jgi:DNA polymerase-1
MSSESTSQPQKLTLLIDADLFLYQAAAAAEDEIDWGDDVWSLATDLTEAKQIFTDKLSQIHDRLETKEQILCFSDRENFRRDVDPSYKSNRKKTRKPVGHKALIDWAKSTYKHYWKPRLEADDCMGIMATSPGANTIIVSDDKDMKTIPGRLYRPMADEMLTISFEDAQRNFYTQVLTGDTTDGYKGIPGIGPKKAETILGSRPDWGIVIHAYQKAGMTETDAKSQARLARILRWSEWDASEGTLKLWEPEHDRQAS